MIYKFTNTNYDYTQSPIYGIYKYYKNGGKYNEQMKKKHCMGGYSPSTDSLIYDGVVRVMGWCFDFRDVFNKYLVKLQYHGWIECYAPSKMFIRDYFGSYRITDKIILLD